MYTLKNTTKLHPLHAESQVTLHTLRWGKEESGYTSVIRIDTDDGLILDKTQAAVLHFLELGETISETGQKTHVSEEVLSNLIRLFSSVGFIKSIDDEKIVNTTIPIRPLLPNVSRKWFSWSINPLFLSVSFTVIILGFGIAFFNPEYLPTFGDFFWTNDFILILLSIHVITLTTTCIHEAMHYIVTRAVGGQGRINLSTRFIYFIFETEHYHLAVIQKPLRYLVYISGIYAELILMSIIMIIFFLSETYQWNIAIMMPYLKVTLLIQLTGLIWQYSAYLQTDFYNVFSEYLNEPNLYVNMKKYIGMKFRSSKNLSLGFITKPLSRLFTTHDVIESADQFSSLTQKEKRQLQIYAVYVCFGLIVSLFTFFYFYVIRDITLFYKALNQTYEAISNHNIGEILRGSIASFLALYFYIMTGIIIASKIKRRESII